MQSNRVSPLTVVGFLFIAVNLTLLYLMVPSSSLPPPPHMTAAATMVPTALPTTVPATPTPRPTSPVLPASMNELMRRRWRESVPWGEHGVANLQRLVGMLTGVPDVVDNYLITVDIGGNVGQTTSRLMREIVARRTDFVMFTYEPMQAYHHIVARATAENWTAHNRFVVFQCAVGARAGTTTFYFDSDTSEQSSQDVGAAGTSKYSRNVSIISMDQFFYDALPASIVRAGSTDAAPVQSNIFFFKMDTEGYDMDVLDGAARLLRERRARFIEFEYNGKWYSQNRNRTLRDVSTMLYESYSYECYFVSARYLHPIFGRWWHPEMETRSWSNVFCGFSGDRYLRWIVRRFDHQDFTPFAPVDLIEFAHE